MMEVNQIVLVVNADIVRRNAARIADYVAHFGAALTVVTKVMRLPPDLIDRAGLRAHTFYDTDARNCSAILHCGAPLLCSQATWKQTKTLPLPEDARVEVFSETIDELREAINDGGDPTIYLDIDEGRDGVRFEEYPRLASALRDVGRTTISIVCNVRCDADSGSPAHFFEPLSASLAELKALGVTVENISLGGSAVLPYLDQIPSLRERTGASISVRVGESIFSGTIPHHEASMPDLKLYNALSVRLPILRSKGSKGYLVAAGYPALEQSSIDSREITIRRQWSEQYSGPKNLDSEMGYSKEVGALHEKTVYGGVQDQDRPRVAAGVEAFDADCGGA